MVCKISNNDFLSLLGREKSQFKMICKTITLNLRSNNTASPLLQRNSSKMILNWKKILLKGETQHKFRLKVHLKTYCQKRSLVH
jgi:hypothetical protein